MQTLLLNPYPPRLFNSNITSDDINTLLSNQQVSITQDKQDKLYKIKGVCFELPLNDQTYPAYFSLVVKLKTRGRRAGIYIFTHIASGGKYLGFSNSLSRRLDQYFNPDPFFSKNYGLLFPFI